MDGGRNVALLVYLYPPQIGKLARGIQHQVKVQCPRLAADMQPRFDASVC